MKHEKDAIDILLATYVDKMPHTVYLQKNPERYPTIEKSVAEITELAKLYDDEAKITAQPDELTGTTLQLDIVTTLFSIDCIDKFCNALKVADTFEVNPLRNGKISVAMTFQDAWMAAPTYEEVNCPFPELQDKKK